MLVVLKDSNSVKILRPCDQSNQWQTSDLELPGLKEFEPASCLFVVSPTKSFAYVAFMNKSLTELKDGILAINREEPVDGPGKLTERFVLHQGLRSAA